MAHTAQNSSKKTYKETYKLQVLAQNNNKKINKLHTFMTFPNQNPKHPKTQSESQTSKNPQCLTSTSKL